jgi:hypothetical protein
MGSGISPSHEEPHELVDQLLNSIPILRVQQSLLADCLQHCPLLLRLHG